MRPDRIVVGEVRDGAALDMLQAMNTGHDGSITTVHANSPRDSCPASRPWCSWPASTCPCAPSASRSAGALDLIIQQARLKDGSRRIIAITEVVGMEGDVITLQDIFTFDFSAGRDEHGRFRGQLVSTGLRPKFTQDLADLGVELPPTCSRSVRDDVGFLPSVRRPGRSSSPWSLPRRRPGRRQGTPRRSCAPR